MKETVWAWSRVESRNEFFFMIMTHEIPYRQTHKLTATRPYYSDHKRFSLCIFSAVCIRFVHNFRSLLSVLPSLLVLLPPLPILHSTAFSLVHWTTLCMPYAVPTTAAAPAAVMSGAPKFMRCVQQKCLVVFVWRVRDLTSVDLYFCVWCLHKNGCVWRERFGEYVKILYFVATGCS